MAAAASAGPRRSRRIRFVWFALALAAVTLALHRSALNGWWRWDDTKILRQALHHPPWEYFVVPGAWQELSPSNLTPWLTLSFAADLAVFGLHPRAFYAHQLVALWVAACMTVILLRRGDGATWPVLGAALFICGAPAGVVAQELMTRHYVEGLLYAILALVLYMRAVREGRPILTWCGGALFLLAISAKEVYVPLVVLLPFLPEGDLRLRVQRMQPFVLVAAAYIVWRWYMLGTPIGGYGHPIDWAAVLDLPLHAVGYVIGKGLQGSITSLVLLVAFGWALRRRWDVLRLAPLAAVLVFGPLVPIAVEAREEGRYLFVASWAFSCLAVLVLQEIARRGRTGVFIALGIYGLMLVAVVSQSWKAQTRLQRWTREVETQGRFVWEAGPHQTLMASPAFAGVLGYAGDLLWIRREVKGDLEGPRLLVDEIELARMDLGRAEVWAYEDACGCLRNISGRTPQILAEWREKLSVKPLSVAIDYRDNVMSWRLGPYRYGVYSLVNGQGVGKVRLPASGRERIALPDPPYQFHIRYDSPDGWITYSTPLAFSPPRETSLRWRR